MPCRSWEELGIELAELAKEMLLNERYTSREFLRRYNVVLDICMKKDLDAISKLSEQMNEIHRSYFSMSYKESIWLNCLWIYLVEDFILHSSKDSSRNIIRYTYNM